MMKIAIQKLAGLIAERICADGFVPAKIKTDELEKSIEAAIETFHSVRGDYIRTFKGTIICEDCLKATLNRLASMAVIKTEDIEGILATF